MKKYWHFIWYAAGFGGLAGLWLHASWSQGPWFPWFAFTMAELTKLQNGIRGGWLDRAFSTSGMTKFAIGSSLAVMIAVTGWIYYFKYVAGPAMDRQGVAEYLQERDRLLREHK